MNLRRLIPLAVLGIGGFYLLFGPGDPSRPNPTKPRPGGGPSFSVQSAYMRFGSQGNDVLNLQQALDVLGYNVGPLDGIYGEMTQSAVREFQRDERLIPDGVAGSQTYGALDSRLRQMGGSFTYVGR